VIFKPKESDAKKSPGSGSNRAEGEPVKHLRFEKQARSRMARGGAMEKHSSLTVRVKLCRSQLHTNAQSLLGESDREGGKKKTYRKKEKEKSGGRGGKRWGLALTQNVEGKRKKNEKGGGTKKHEERKGGRCEYQRLKGRGQGAKGRGWRLAHKRGKKGFTLSARLLKKQEKKMGKKGREEGIGRSIRGKESSWGEKNSEVRLLGFQKKKNGVKEIDH